MAELWLTIIWYDPGSINLVNHESWRHPRRTNAETHDLSEDYYTLRYVVFYMCHCNI